MPDERRRQIDPKLRLQFVAVRRLRQQGELPKRAIEMIESLRIGRRMDAVMAGLAPPADRLLGLVRQGMVMGDHFRMRAGHIRKTRFQGLSDPGVQFSPLAPQQGFVCRIPDQGVFELVARIRWQPAHVDQFGVRKLCQPRLQFIFGHRCYGGEQLVRKLTSQDRAQLRNILGPAEPVETRGQRVLERRWNIALAQAAAALQHQSGQFLGKERHAVGAFDHGVDHLRGQPIARDHAGDQLARFAEVQAIEHEHCVMRLHRPGRAELRARRTQEQQRHRGALLGQDLQQFQG